MCRKHAKDGWALDDVVNCTEVLRQEREDVRKGPDEGAYFYGLFLEGCKWDKPGNKLTDSDPKVLFAPLPVLHVTGALAVSGGAAASGAPTYSCPCYKNPKRTGLNFICARLPRSKPLTGLQPQRAGACPTAHPSLGHAHAPACFHEWPRHTRDTRRVWRAECAPPRAHALPFGPSSARPQSPSTCAAKTYLQSGCCGASAC